MAKNQIYFISDVHIGSNDPTNWYQDDVHGPYLEAALNYISANSSVMQELVLLGDFVDQWVYPPDVKPPSFAKIVQMNPRIFGGTINGQMVPGALLATLDALEGNITYLNGNHDMFVTAGDIATLKSPKGLNIKMVTDIFYTPSNFGNQLFCTHGHVYSMFNAPDFHGFLQYPGLPMGFFISRLAARWSTQQFTPEAPNDAYLPGSGNPNGSVFQSKALEGIYQSLEKGQGRISQLLMSALLSATGNHDKSFIMPDGQCVDVQQVEDAYKDMYNQYPGSTNVPISYFKDGETNARFSALGQTDAFNDLTSFAQQLAYDKKVVVMGHTHVPLESIREIWGPSPHKALYANSGFQCPSIPDMATTQKQKYPTFVEVLNDSNKNLFIVSVYKVIKSGTQYKISLDSQNQISR